MRRVRARARRRDRAAYQTPFSWMFLVSLLTLVLIWRLYALYLTVAVPCVDAVGLTLGGIRHGPSVIGLFTLAFVALAALWFFNLVRYRDVRQSYVRRAVEAVLIGFGLLTVMTWTEYVAPNLPDARITQSIRQDYLARVPILGSLGYAVEEGSEEIVLNVPPPSGVEWGSFPELDDPTAYVDDERFVFGIFKRPASQCLCWSQHDEWVRTEHHYINAWEYYGFYTPEEAAARRKELPDPPVEAEWCPAVRDLARLPR